MRCGGVMAGSSEQAGTPTRFVASVIQKATDAELIMALLERGPASSRRLASGRVKLSIELDPRDERVQTPAPARRKRDPRGKDPYGLAN